MEIIQVIEKEGFSPIRLGDKYKMICPFHEDKDPSFVIYPETNSWWCFGCNNGGDSIEFIKILYDISFIDALKYLKIKTNKAEVIKRKPGMLQILLNEERMGINIEKKYGKEFVDRLLMKKIIDDSNKNVIQNVFRKIG